MFFILAVSITFMSGSAFADGKHKAKFKVKNDSEKPACVWVYNGNDKSKSSPHDQHWVEIGEEITVKCQCYSLIRLAPYIFPTKKRLEG